MNTRTRYVVITSALVLAVGLGTGLVAYYGGFPTAAFSQQAGPDELKFVPADATLVAYADVQHIMSSGLRQKLRFVLPHKEDGRQDFQDHTGINIETDIDRVVAFAASTGEVGVGFPGSAMVLARGRFDVVKIEALMREHGATVEEYKGKRLVVGEAVNDKPALSVAFLEPGLVAVGTKLLVYRAVDLKDGGASILTNEEMMALIRNLDSGNAWAAGRFDELTAHAPIPAGVRDRLPPITKFSASARIDDGVSVVLQGETKDDESANNLREVIRGGMALAKLQAGSKPEFLGLMQSFQLGGAGKTVSLSFDLPAQVIDALGQFAGQHAHDRTSQTQRP